MNTDAREEAFRQTLKQALSEAVMEEWEEMASQQVRHLVSLRCRSKMKRILSGKSVNQMNRTLAKKIVIGILVAVAVFTMLGMAIPPVQEAVVKTIITWYETNFGVRYEVETEEQIPTVIEEVILPAWLPDGWTMETVMTSNAEVSHILSDGRGSEIFVGQYPIDPDNDTNWFDNTDVTIQTTTLNGTIEAKLFSYTDGSCTLTWADKYVFNLIWSSENADASMLLRIAESMR